MAGYWIHWPPLVFTSPCTVDAGLLMRGKPSASKLVAFTQSVTRLMLTWSSWFEAMGGMRGAFGAFWIRRRIIECPASCGTSTRFALSPRSSASATACS